MKHLIIYAHPNKESLNSYFRTTAEQTLAQTGHEIMVRDLYELGFNPVLSLDDIVGQMKGAVEEEIKREQEFIRWADVLIFIYPIWWTGMPAIMKGYIDRVMSYGFAYIYNQGIQQGLLKGKQAVIINTHGKSREEYAASGMDNALSLTSDKGIYTYCGLEIIEHFFFAGANRVTPEVAKQWAEIIRGILKSLHQEQNPKCRSGA